MPALPLQDHAENITKYRVYYNDKLKDIGFEAPTPKAGQKGGDYRRKSLQTFADSLLPQHHQFAKMDWCDQERMPYDVLKNLEPQLLQHCGTEYQNPLNVPPGTFREIKKRQPNGQEFTEFIGRDNFCKFMGRPGRRVVGFRTDQGYMNTNGQFLR
jgi:hypothetical protein